MSNNCTLTSEPTGKPMRDTEVNNLSRLPPELEKIPLGIRILDAPALKRLEAAMDPDGNEPFHSNAWGVSFTLFDYTGAAMSAFVLALAIFPLTIIGEFADMPDLMNMLAEIAILFLGVTMLWMFYSIARTCRLHLLRTVLVIEPDQIRWRRTSLFGATNRVFLNEGLLRAELLRQGNRYEAVLTLRTGEVLSPCKTFISLQKAAWLAWMLHKTAHLELGGNTSLKNLGRQLASGKMRLDGLTDKNDEPVLGPGIPPESLEAAPPPEGKNDGFSFYHASAPDIPDEARRILDSECSVPAAGDAAVLRDHRRWGRAIYILAMTALWYAMLTASWDKAVDGALETAKRLAARAGGVAFLALLVGGFFHLAFGKTWLLFAGGTLVRRRQWLWLKLTHRFDREDILAVECVRDGQNPDAYDIFLRTGGQGKRKLFGHVDAATERWLPPMIARWAGVPLKKRLTLQPDDTENALQQ